MVPFLDLSIVIKDCLLLAIINFYKELVGLLDGVYLPLSKTNEESTDYSFLVV